MLGRSVSLPRIITSPLSLAVLIAGLTANPAVVAADTTIQSATVIISDTGFAPAAITVSVGATVTWKNQGANVHTASSVAGINPSFDTGGISTGQAASIT